MCSHSIFLNDVRLSIWFLKPYFYWCCQFLFIKQKNDNKLQECWGNEIQPSCKFCTPETKHFYGFGWVLVLGCRYNFSICGFLRSKLHVSFELGPSEDWINNTTLNISICYIVCSYKSSKRVLSKLKESCMRQAAQKNLPNVMKYLLKLKNQNPQEIYKKKFEKSSWKCNNPFAALCWTFLWGHTLSQTPWVRGSCSPWSESRMSGSQSNSWQTTTSDF